MRVLDGGEGESEHGLMMGCTERRGNEKQECGERGEKGEKGEDLKGRGAAERAAGT